MREKREQITAGITEEHSKMLMEIWDHYKAAFPLATVRKYKVIETIIEDQHRAIFGKEEI